jgi:glycosyltransferase involved in cell wall biosynthesis
LGRRHLADADALWVFNSPATVPLVAEGVRKRYGVPYLLHIMDVWPDSVLESGMVGSSSARGVANRMLTSLVRRGYEGASTIAVTSPGQLSLLTSRGVPANRLEYCPVWADESVFHPQPCDRTLLPEKARSAGKVLMYAGALGHVQGLDTAVRAAAAARSTGLHLVLVGSGIAEAGLRSLAESLQADHVHFLGRRSPDEMGALGSAADVHLVSLVDNPLLRVTMPSKLPSIMALGKPVIMCGAGDAADVVKDAGAGVVTAAGSVEEFADVLRRITDCEERELVAWGRAGRAYYERVFSKASGVSHVESMLETMSR